MSRVCKRCCLHERRLAPLEELREVARGFGMKTLKRGDYRIYNGATPTETWSLPVKLDKPAWNGSTHEYRYFSIPRHEICSIGEFWRWYDDFVRGCRRALDEGDVATERRHTAIWLLNSLIERYE